MKPFSRRTTGASRGSTYSPFESSRDAGASGDARPRTPTQTTLPNGIAQIYAFDQASRLASITYRKNIQTLGDLNYDYDQAGRRTAVWGAFARTSLPQAFASRTYNQANQLTAQGSLAYSYDLNGNLTGDPNLTFAWNPRNQMASQTVRSGKPGVAASYVYDPFGRRQQKTVGTTTTGFLYDGQNAVQELAGTGTTVGANLLTGLGIDETFERSGTAGTSDYLADALGSTVALSDTLGAIQTSYSYGPFGAVSQTGAASANAFKWTGREDDGTGLQYNRARYYSPGLQRFVAEDPIGFRGGDVNLYGYTGGDPVNAKDPSGLSAVGCLHTPQAWPVFAPSSPLGCEGVASSEDCKLWKCWGNPECQAAPAQWGPNDCTFSFPEERQELPPCNLLASNDPSDLDIERLVRCSHEPEADPHPHLDWYLPYPSPQHPVPAWVFPEPAPILAPAG